MSGKGGMTLLELKMRAKAKEEEEKARLARKRNILVLVLDFCAKNGYTDTLHHLAAESGVSLARWSPADNVDLQSIFQEFEAFTELKYGRQPRLVRPATGGGEEGAEEEKAQGKVKRRQTTVGSSSGGGGGSVSGGGGGVGAPLPPLPAGMGSTPSALPAAYRSSYAAVDGYQGNSMDMATGMTNSGGGSIEAQSVGGSSAAGKDRRAGAHSAKGSKEAAAAASAAAASEQTSQTGRTPARSEKRSKGSSSSSASSKDKASVSSASANPLELGVQGSASGSSSASSAPSHHKSSSLSLSASSRSRPAPSPARSPSPPPPPPAAAEAEDADPAGAHASFYETRLLKPMPEYADAQFRELAHIITRDIYTANPNVRWGDIAELGEAKQLLQEAVVMPLKFPQFFTGLLSPWKGVLLYGPPGTGKTMLARAVATECRTTFFNISASSIVSKFRGDSEKLVRVLFELARYHAPSTVFIDEIDSIMGRRDAAGEHEGSRRMKTELLIQMDGLSKSSDLVFVLAASNLPWDLDVALLRRLEKRILVPLPNERARLTMLRTHLTEGERAQGVDYQELARRTEGYSGSDIALLCKEAAMRPVRRLMQQLMRVEPDPTAEVSSEVRLDPVVESDVRAALACTRPSAQSKFLNKYTEWHAEYGAGIHDVQMDGQEE